MMIRNLALTILLASGMALAQAAQQLPDAPGMPNAPGVPAVQITPSGPTAIIDTSMGRLTCRFFNNEAPIATANFIDLANGTKDWIDPDTKLRQRGVPFYNGTTFHRVIPGFMIQGGDKAGDGTGDAGYYFKNETIAALRFDVPGRLAMANSGPNTNSTQFFITEASQPDLDGSYTIFGQCDAASVALATQIANVPRNNDDKPLKAVTIKKVTIVKDGEPIPPDPMPPAQPAAPSPASALPAAR